MEFTVVIEETEDGWLIGQIQEVPEVLTHGKTLEELKSNLQDALSLVWDANREDTKKKYLGKKITENRMELSA